MTSLYKYFDIPGVSKKSRRLLEAMIHATIAGRAYNVDSIGLDLCGVVVTDAPAVINKLIQDLGKAIPGLDVKTPKTMEMTGGSLYRQAYDIGSFLYRCDIQRLRALSKNSARRTAMTVLYKASGANRLHSVRLEEITAAQTGPAFVVTEPAVSSLVIDSYEQVAGVLRKNQSKATRDQFFDRYIYSLDYLSGSGADDNDNDVDKDNHSNVLERDYHSYVSLPDSTLSTRLRGLVSVASTLEGAGKKIDVKWAFGGRKHFHEALDKRWEKEETRGTMSLDAYTKVKKLAALFALARNLYEPCITQKDVIEALSYLEYETSVKAGEAEKRADMSFEEQRRDIFMRKIKENIAAPYEDNVSYSSKPFLHELGMVAAAHMQLVCSKSKPFYGDPVLNVRQAFSRTVDSLVDLGLIEIVPSTNKIYETGGGLTGKGRIRSDIIYLKGAHPERVNEWK